MNRLAGIDARIQGKEDYQRLILDELLYFFPGPYIMISVYIDESGTHKQSKVACIAGLMYDRKKIRLLSRAWKRALDWAEIDSFHAKEYYQRIKRIGAKKEDKLYRRLIKLIKRYRAGGAVVFVTSEQRFEEVCKSLSWKYSQYTTCAYACIKLFLEKAGQLGEQVHFSIARGHKNLGELDNLLKRLSKAGLSGLYDFRETKGLLPLQSADLWAYEARKRVADARKAIDENVPIHCPRKSLTVLIEDDPTMIQMSLDENTLPVIFEQVRGLLADER